MAQFVGHVNPGVEAGDAIRQAIAIQEAKRIAQVMAEQKAAQQNFENRMKVGEFGLNQDKFGLDRSKFGLDVAKYGNIELPKSAADIANLNARTGETTQGVDIKNEARRTIGGLSAVGIGGRPSMRDAATLKLSGVDVMTPTAENFSVTPQQQGAEAGQQASAAFAGGGEDVLQKTQDIIGKRQKDVAASRPGGYGSTPYFTVNTDGDLVAVNRRDLTQTVLPDVNPATAQQRDATVGRNRASPVIKSIADLSEKINTGQGVMAKLAGGAEKLAAKANLDDDVAEYQAVVSSFTPLVARALGHVGVLTQQDVDSVREIFPKPGDSKSLRDRKVNRLVTLMGEIKAAGKGDDTQPDTGRAVGGPKVGERRDFGGKIGVWDGQGWKPE